MQKQVLCIYFEAILRQSTGRQNGQRTSNCSLPSSVACGRLITFEHSLFTYLIIRITIPQNLLMSANEVLRRNVYAVGVPNVTPLRLGGVYFRF